jgi:hypothetical protein
VAGLSLPSPIVDFVDCSPFSASSGSHSWLEY